MEERGRGVRSSIGSCLREKRPEGEGSGEGERKRGDGKRVVRRDATAQHII